jgi:hypothetical protein
MVVAVLQFEVLVRGSESLKDKRRVVKAIKDRLHREHLVSVAEVGAHDSLARGVMGLALVATDGKRAGQVLDQITAKLRSCFGGTVLFDLGDTSREILHGQGGGSAGDEGDEQPDARLSEEMRRRADEQRPEHQQERA